MAGLPGSLQSLIPAGPDELVRRMRDLERHLQETGASTARSFDPVVADLAAKQAALEAQVTFLSGQTSGYASAKDWNITGASGPVGGGYELQTYDPTYDDEYVFQASSTGVLQIMVSAMVKVKNDSTTSWGVTYRGYSLSWSGGSLAWDPVRAARVGGVNCGAVICNASNIDIVTVPSNATVTLRTCRAKESPVAPETTQHRVQETTVVVTRVGI